VNEQLAPILNYFPSTTADYYASVYSTDNFNYSALRIIQSAKKQLYETSGVIKKTSCD